MPGSSAPKGSVEEEQARSPQERLRDGEPLLHAARQGVRIERAGVGEPDARQHRVGLVERAPPGGAEEAARAGRVAQFGDDEEVMKGGEIRERGIALEYDAAFRHRLGRQRAPAEGHRSGGRLLLAQQESQERRLAAAARADDRAELAGLDRHADALEHHGVAVALLEAAHDDPAHGRLRAGCVQGDSLRESAARPASVTTASRVIHAT